MNLEDLPAHLVPLKTFYKYRPIWDNIREKKPSDFTRALFQKRALWFSTPEAFNDPFDCNLVLMIDGTDEEHHSFCLKLIDRGHPDVPVIPPEVRQNLWNAKPWRKPGFAHGIFTRARDRIYKESSVFCWCLDGLNIPMFSYYANDHRGIALEFEVSMLDPIGRALPVQYRDDLPDLNYLKLHDDPQLSKTLIFTKAACWGHEKEYRVFRPNTPAGLVEFSPANLKRITFGPRASEEEEGIVMGWLADWPTKVTLTRTRLSTQRFELIPEDFSVIGGA